MADVKSGPSLDSTPHYTQAKEDEMGRECSTNGEEEECILDIGRKAEGKRPLGRPRRSWVDNIKMDLREIGWDVVLTGLIWLRIGTSDLMNTIMNLQVP
jgi:hypothetical protein